MKSFPTLLGLWFLITNPNPAHAISNASAPQRLERCLHQEVRCVFVKPDVIETQFDLPGRKHVHLSEALVLLRAIRHSEPGVLDVVLYLRGGDYRLSSTILISSLDTGETAGRTEFRAFPGERPVIYGSRRISSESNGSPLVRFDASELRPYRDVARSLYSGAIRLVRARWPNGNSGRSLGSWGPPEASRDESARDSYWIEVEKNNLPFDSNLLGQEIHVEREFGYNILRIDGVEDLGSKVRLRFVGEDAKFAFNQTYPRKMPGQNFHLEFTADQLDEYSEWSFSDDGTSQIVAFKDSVCKPLCHLEVPVLSTFIKIEGRPGRVAKNIIIAGLSFQYSSWLEHPGSYIPDQGAARVNINRGKQRIAAGIEMEYVEGVSVEGCTFTLLATHGVYIVGSASNVSIASNKFKDIGGGAVYVDGYLSEKFQTGEGISGLSVAENRIERYGQIYRDAVAIFFGYVSDSEILGNRIAGGSYSGISLGWGWTNRITVMRNNRTSRNRITDVMADLTDGAGIYVLANQPSSLVSDNFIKLHPKVQSGPFEFVVGVYFDKGVEAMIAIDNRVIFSGANSGRRWLKYFDQVGNIANQVLGPH